VIGHNTILPDLSTSAMDTTGSSSAGDVAPTGGDTAPGGRRLSTGQRGSRCGVKGGDCQGSVFVHHGVVGELSEDLFGPEAGPGRDGAEAAAGVCGQPDLRPEFVLRFLAFFHPRGVPVPGALLPRLPLLGPGCPLSVLGGVVCLLPGRLKQGSDPAPFGATDEMISRGDEIGAEGRVRLVDEL
jgi:hypothetical protein